MDFVLRNTAGEREFKEGGGLEGGGGTGFAGEVVVTGVTLGVTSAMRTFGLGLGRAGAGGGDTMVAAVLAPSALRVFGLDGLGGTRHVSLVR